MSACWQEVVKLPRFLEAAGVGETPKSFGPSWFVKRGAKTFRYGLGGTGLGAGSIDNGDGTFTCSDGSIVTDPNACAPPIAAGVHDNGDGTFTCQDGSVVSDPSTCPQPGGGGSGPGLPGNPPGGAHETSAVLNPDGSTTIFWSDGTTTTVPAAKGGGSVVQGGGQGGGGSNPPVITPVNPPATTASPTNYAPYILGAAAVAGAGIIGYAVYRRKKRGRR